MNKQTVITILLAFVASIPVLSQTSPTRTIWERKSAPAVILGRYVDREPGDKDKIPDFLGNNESLKGGSFPDFTTDSVAGTFTITWDICYPLKHNFQGWSVMLFPGDTVRVNFNKKAFGEYQTYNRETPYESITTPKLRELWKKAIRIEDASFELPLPIHMKGMKLGSRLLFMGSRLLLTRRLPMKFSHVRKIHGERPPKQRLSSNWKFDYPV